MTKAKIECPAKKNDMVCVVRRFSYHSAGMKVTNYTKAFLAKVTKASRQGLVLEYSIIGENLSRRVAYMQDTVMTIASKQDEAKRLVASWAPEDVERNREGFEDAQMIRDAILSV